jgi:vancomycin permeability regulator SanA
VAVVGDFVGRIRWKRVLIAFGLLAVVVATPWVWVQTSSAAYRHDAADVPDAPVALVLGAGLTRPGTPSPFLAGRLDVAADLYRRGKVEVLLVSGDNSTTDYDEPTAMRTYLIGRGVPADVVVADYAGLDTWDSCTRAKRIFGVERATVVTQEFHQATTTAYGHFREVFAAGKAMWDGLVAKPDPRFLGPRETGVTSALRR